MANANALQKHVFEDLGTKLNELAALNAMHPNDAQVRDYINLTASAYGATLDMVATSTPSQMIAAHKFSSGLHEIAQIAVEAKQGASSESRADRWATIESEIRSLPAFREAQASIDYTNQKARNFIAHPIQMTKEAFQAFLDLPIDKQAEKIIEAMAAASAAYAGNNSGNGPIVPQVAKIIRAEVAALTASGATAQVVTARTVAPCFYYFKERIGYQANPNQANPNSEIKSVINTKNGVKSDGSASSSSAKSAGEALDKVPDFIKGKRIPQDSETILKSAKFSKTNMIETKCKSRVYKSDGKYYHRDTFHKDLGAHLEVYNSQYQHLGKANPLTGEIIPNTIVKGRTLNV